MCLKDTKSLAFQMVCDQGGNVFLIVYYKDFHDCASSQVISVT